MLAKLQLRNFRGFRDHTVPLRRMSVIVGQNNAGKTTLVEAFRLVGLAVNRQRLDVRAVPDWLDLPQRNRGIVFSLRGLEVSTTTLFHRYGQPPASIIATFENGASTTVYLGGDGGAFAVFAERGGARATTPGTIRALGLREIGILPPIGPLLRNEAVLTPDYVRSAYGSPLSSQHFRNQLKVFSDDLQEFRELAERTWSGMRVLGLEGADQLPGRDTEIQLLIRDADFAAEVALMGHGVQIWLQTMWFLTRSRNAATLILDEPDVYLHSDLQRRLVRLLKRRDQQVIVATHSVEIISEVEPEQILVVDKRRSASAFTANLPAAQQLVDRLGGVHNLALARMWNARRCLAVEGDDLRTLKHLHAVLFPGAEDPIDALPSLELGGWSGWSSVLHLPALLRNAAGEQITFYCLLDRDYRIEPQVRRRYEEAAQHRIELHVWKRKELENYLLVPSAIRRAVELDTPRDVPTEDEVSQELDRIIIDFRDAVFDSTVNEAQAFDRAAGVQRAIRIARDVVDQAYATADGRLAVAPGKDVLSRLSAWLQVRCGVSLGATRIARSMGRNEIAPEVAHVVTAIETGQPLG
jgi:hypothetical protein